MTPEKVDQLLSDYKTIKGRCQYLEALIVEMKADARAWRNNLACELAGASGKEMDGMPRGNAVGNPTERIGILLASGYTPDGLKELEALTKQYEQELSQKSATLRFVDAWLVGLTEKEQWIIRQQVLEGAFWREIIREYEKKYGEQYSKEGLKRIKHNALMKIYKMAA
jgi:hypothetical protein